MPTLFCGLIKYKGEDDHGYVCPILLFLTAEFEYDLGSGLRWGKIVPSL